MSVVNTLRQNNPRSACITIVLGRETLDADLAQALQHNPFVREITLDLHGGGEQGAADWTSLLRVIATRANLETVKVRDAVISVYRRRSETGLVRSILRAILQQIGERELC